MAMPPPHLPTGARAGGGPDREGWNPDRGPLPGSPPSPLHRPPLRAGGHMRSCLGRARSSQSTGGGAAGTSEHQRAPSPAPRCPAGRTGHAWGLVPGSPGLPWAWPPLGVNKTRPLGAPIPVKGDQQTSVTPVNARRTGASPRHSGSRGHQPTASPCGVTAVGTGGQATPDRQQERLGGPRPQGREPGTVLRRSAPSSISIPLLLGGGGGPGPVPPRPRESEAPSPGQAASPAHGRLRGPAWERPGGPCSCPRPE